MTGTPTWPCYASARTSSSEGWATARFERANEALGIDGGDTWTVAFSATWEGPNDLPTLAFGDYLTSDRESCEDSRLLRPAPDGDGYAAPLALSPGYCTLSMLFSDWSRTGRRDLRLTNDRHYYRDGSDQLWRVAPGEAPQLYTEADGWRPLQIWGMGIASEDLTGDGRPEVFLTSQGDNKLQTLADGPTRPAYEDIALGAWGHRAPPVRRRRRAAVDGVARRVRRRQQRRVQRPVRRQGQRRGRGGLRHP